MVLVHRLLQRLGVPERCDLAAIRDLAEQVARDIPILLIFRQEGLAEQGWTDYPFWWPVLIAPHEATPCVYARGQT